MNHKKIDRLIVKNNEEPSVKKVQLDHMVFIVRRWLRGGVSNANLKSSVRIREVNELGGGLKSPVVGALAVNVQVVIKQGSSELVLHRKMMNEVNRIASAKKKSRVQTAVFPEVMFVEKLAGFEKDRDHLMIQQEMVNYNSVQNLLYDEAAPLARILQGIESGIASLNLIHGIAPTSRGALKDFPRKPDPFSSRLKKGISGLKAKVEWLDRVFQFGAVIDGVELPPLNDIFKILVKWQKTRTRNASLVLLHGDPHIANLMTRSRGNSVSARWIDPNPTLGFSDPAYDWGKLLHFVEPVGWAKHSAESIGVCVESEKNRVKILTSVIKPNPKTEKARSRIEEMIRERAISMLPGQAEAALELAIASAHIGYASLEISPNLNSHEQKNADTRRQFALALTLRSLGLWHSLKGQSV